MAGGTAKAPAHTSPRYVAARVRKILAAQGWPLSKSTGQYSVFGGGTKRITEGYRVHRVGVSRYVAVTYNEGYANGRGRNLPRGVALAKAQEAWTCLRSLGYRVNDVGWIECDYDD